MKIELNYVTAKVSGWHLNIDMAGGFSGTFWFSAKPTAKQIRWCKNRMRDGV